MKRIVCDMSAILWAGLKAGVDREFGQKLPDPKNEEKTVFINGWQHGYENAVSSLVSTLNKFSAAPKDLLMVWDGKNAKLFRRAFDPGYKEGRDHMPEEYEQFSLLREKIEQTFLDLGASSIWVDGWEADDVIAHLAKNLHCETVVVSTDNDLAVLQGGRVSTYIGGELNHNKYGPWPAHFITCYKALVGDTSDRIKGVKGFGDKAFLDLYVRYGDDGLELMSEMLDTGTLDKLEEDVEDFPKLKTILNDLEGAYRSWKCAKLYPHMVNTMRKPLEYKCGMVKPGPHPDERLAKWAGVTHLVHAGNLTKLSDDITRNIAVAEFVALDIETSANDTSDEWIENLRQNKGEDDQVGIDVFGHELTGLGITCGPNSNVTYYFTVDHREEGAVRNLSSDQVRRIVERIKPTQLKVIHNVSFELSVLQREWGEAWKDNGLMGMLPNVVDTKLMASYVNENIRHGLKGLSKRFLNYDQTNYDEVTTLEAPVEDLPPGGRLIETREENGFIFEKRQYRMNELTAQQVLAYGADDTICTAALYHWFRTVMALENTWGAFCRIEIDPAYLTAAAFNQGQVWNPELIAELAEDDAKKREAGWAVLRQFLIDQGWEGTQCPVYTEEITAAQIKEAYQLVTGRELETRVRTPSKIAALIEEKGEYELAKAIDLTLTGDARLLNTMVKAHFSGEPALNMDSPKQLAKLLYETMGLPIRLRNKPTDKMREAGEPGSPKTDDLALQYALKYDVEGRPELEKVVRAFQAIRVADTKAKIYYRPYRYVFHWKDQKVRPQYNQCATNTRRYSCGGPNQQQMAKHEKHGEKPRIREAVLAHHKDAVIVPPDFSGQELRIIADYSKDKELLACYVGDQTKDMHSLTAVGIVRRKPAEELWRLCTVENKDVRTLSDEDQATFREWAALWKNMTYEQFVEILHGSGPMFPMAKKMRAVAKSVNFASNYGAQAAKLAETLLVDQEEGKVYVDAYNTAFSGVLRWKDEVVAEARRNGYVTTMMGVRRHLAELLNSFDGFTRSKAERQAVNFKVQGSAAEMTKLAMGRCWSAKLLERYDCRFYGPIHDELVWSVHKDQAVEFTRELHALMTEPYATMSVPIVASVSVGRSFGKQLEVSDEFEATLLQEAVDSLFQTEELKQAA